HAGRLQPLRRTQGEGQGDDRAFARRGDCVEGEVHRKEGPRPLRQTRQSAAPDVMAHAGATPPMLRQLRHDVWATEQLIGYCRGGDVDGDRLITDTPLRRPDQPRFEMNAWAPLTQFVHHGSDHRAQINTTLSAHGIEPPDLQVWPYSMELGASRETK